MRYIPIVFAALLAFCGVASATHFATVNWYASYGDPNPKFDAFNSFLWPAKPYTEPHYILRPNAGQFPTDNSAQLAALKTKTLTVQYRVDTVSGTPLLQSTECTSTQNKQARVALLLRRSTDNSQRFHRAWLNSRPRIQADGVTYTITATLDGVGWAFVNGGNDTPANYPGKWNDLLDNLKDIGLTFNGCSSAGHGAYAINGTARFTIVSVTVQ
jgi:hypothetical protein